MESIQSYELVACVSYQTVRLNHGRRLPGLPAATVAGRCADFTQRFLSMSPTWNAREYRSSPAATAKYGSSINFKTIDRKGTSCSTILHAPR